MEKPGKTSSAIHVLLIGKTGGDIVCRPLTPTSQAQTHQGCSPAHAAPALSSPQTHPGSQAGTCTCIRHVSLYELLPFN
eukprot:scaffold58299_cov19-Tisochrysis_lutea.AAC.3